MDKELLDFMDAQGIGVRCNVADTLDGFVVSFQCFVVLDTKGKERNIGDAKPTVREAIKSAHDDFKRV